MSCIAVEERGDDVFVRLTPDGVEWTNRLAALALVHAAYRENVEQMDSDGAKLLCRVARRLELALNVWLLADSLKKFNQTKLD